MPELVDLVARSLEPYQPTGYKINLVKESVQKRGDTWYAVVEPSREDVESYDFNARVADAAADLMDRQDVDVQLTTVMPQFADWPATPSEVSQLEW